VKLQEELDAGEWRRENSTMTTKKRENSHVNLLKGLIMTILYEDDHDTNTTTKWIIVRKKLKLKIKLTIFVWTHSLTFRLSPGRRMKRGD